MKRYIKSSVDWDATDVVTNLYRNFPEVDFVRESDLKNDKVILFFEFKSYPSGLTEFLDEHDIDYKIDYDGKLTVYSFEGWYDEFGERIESAEEVEKEYYDMGNDEEYWYYTKHGVGPGSVPKGLDIVRYEYDDDDPYGEYFSTRGQVLKTDALKWYDIKEQIPKKYRDKK